MPSQFLLPAHQWSHRIILCRHNFDVICPARLKAVLCVSLDRDGEDYRGAGVSVLGEYQRLSQEQRRRCGRCPGRLHHLRRLSLGK